MTIAIVGNSHTIAIKRAIETRGADQIGRPSFLFIKEKWQIDYCDDGGRLRPRLAILSPKEGEVSSLPIDGHDAVVVSAGGWWAPRNEFVEIEKPTHPLGHIARPMWRSAFARADHGVYLTSSAVFEATAEAWIRAHPMIELLKDVARVCGGRVFLQPWPAPNRALKSDPNWFLNRWYGDRGSIAWRDFFAAQFQALRVIVAEMEPRVTLLDYPLDEICDDGFMDSSLCEKDPFHGNENYGALIVQQIAARL